MLHTVINHPLRPLHGHRTQLPHLPRHLHRPLHHAVPSPLNGLAHEPHALRLPRPELPRRQAHLLDPGEVRHAFREARQGADVRGDPDCRFADGEPRVRAGEPDVARGREVDGGAVGVAVQGADDGFEAGGEG